MNGASVTYRIVSDSLAYMQLWAQKERRKRGNKRKKFEIIANNFPSLRKTTNLQT